MHTIMHEGVAREGGVWGGGVTVDTVEFTEGHDDGQKY